MQTTAADLFEALYVGHGQIAGDDYVLATSERQNAEIQAEFPGLVLEVEGVPASIENAKVLAELLTEDQKGFLVNRYGYEVFEDLLAVWETT